MTKRRMWLLPGVLLALAALACGPMLTEPPTQTPLAYWGTRTATPARSPQANGTAALAGTAPAQQAGSSLDLSTASLFGQAAGLQSYRMTLDFTFNGTKADGTAVSGSLSGQGAYQVDPPANTLNLTVAGAAQNGQAQNIQFTQIGDTTYLVAAGTGCIISSASSDQTNNQYGSFVAGSGFLTGPVQRVLPDEQINGVNTNVYVLTPANLNSSAGYSLDQITNGRLYLAQPGGYVVRVLLEGTGKSEALSGDPNATGTVHYQIDFSDFGQPVNIAAPPGCEQAAQTDFPVLDDASNISSGGGLYSYKSNHTFDDAISFYRTQMAAAGWTAGQESIQPPTGLLLFTRGGQQATITIAQEGAGISVAITSGQPS